MKWRIVPLETHGAAMNMAIDESVAEHIATGGSPPTIRFYRWKPSAVSIGCFQSMQDEVDLRTCKELGVDVVRRRTGGGAVYHDYDGEITYSVIAPEGLLPKDITASYKVICGWIVDALSLLGIQSGFRPVNDIVAGERKISGNAQTRRGGILLQHGTILYCLDVRKMFSLLKVGADKISDKMISSVEERVTCVSRLKPGLDMEEVHQALIRSFTKGKQFEFGAWKKEELKRAQELAQIRYGSDTWNFQR